MMSDTDDDYPHTNNPLDLSDNEIDDDISVGSRLSIGPRSVGSPMKSVEPQLLSSSYKNSKKLLR